MIVTLRMSDIECDVFAPADLFQKQMEQIYAAEMREATGIEFHLDFFRAVGHATKAYIMDGFVAMMARCKRAMSMALF